MVRIWKYDKVVYGSRCWPEPLLVLIVNNIFSLGQNIIFEQTSKLCLIFILLDYSALSIREDKTKLFVMIVATTFVFRTMCGPRYFYWTLFFHFLVTDLRSSISLISDTGSLKYTRRGPPSAIEVRSRVVNLTPVSSGQWRTQSYKGQVQIYNFQRENALQYTNNVMSSMTVCSKKFCNAQPQLQPVWFVTYLSHITHHSWRNI